MQTSNYLLAEFVPEYYNLIWFDRLVRWYKPATNVTFDKLYTRTTHVISTGAMFMARLKELLCGNIPYINKSFYQYWMLAYLFLLYLSRPGFPS